MCGDEGRIGIWVEGKQSTVVLNDVVVGAAGYFGDDAGEDGEPPSYMIYYAVSEAKASFVDHGFST